MSPDLSTALQGLPIAAAVAVAILWTKVSRLERDRSEDAKLVSELGKVVTELKTTMEHVKEIVGHLVRIDLPREPF